MDPIETLMARLLAVCGTLGYPVDRDRAYEGDEDSLPRIAVWSGPERSVPQAGQGPASAWAEEADISPVVEVMIEDDEPAVVAEQIRVVWRALRAALRAEDWTKVTVGGSQPRYEKTSLNVDDKPGVSGFAVIMDFRVYVD